MIITTIIYMCEKLKPPIPIPIPSSQAQISRDPPDLERVGYDGGGDRGGGDPGGGEAPGVIIGRGAGWRL